MAPGQVCRIIMTAFTSPSIKERLKMIGKQTQAGTYAECVCTCTGEIMHMCAMSLSLSAHSFSLAASFIFPLGREAIN